MKFLNSILMFVLALGMAASAQTATFTTEVPTACGVLQYSITPQPQGTVNCGGVLTDKGTLGYNPVWNQTVYPVWPGFNLVTLPGYGSAKVTSFVRTDTHTTVNGREVYLDTLTFVALDGSYFGTASVFTDVWWFKITKKQWDVLPGSVFHITLK